MLSFINFHWYITVHIFCDICASNTSHILPSEKMDTMHHLVVNLPVWQIACGLTSVWMFIRLWRFWKTEQETRRLIVPNIEMETVKVLTSELRNLNSIGEKWCLGLWYVCKLCLMNTLMLLKIGYFWNKCYSSFGIVVNGLESRKFYKNPVTFKNLMK